MIFKPFAFFCRVLLIASCAGFAYGVVGIGLRYQAVGVVMLVLLTWARLKGWRGSGWSHGTARWAEVTDLCRNRLLGDRGPILGRVDASPPTRGQAIRMLFSTTIPSGMACQLFLTAFLGEGWGSGRLVRPSSHVHLMTCAPSGRGKGTNVIIPNLLALTGSIVVTDPGAGNYKATAHHRRKRFRHRVLRVDPFGQAGPGADRFNPLLCLDPKTDDFLDQCRDIANMMVVRLGTEHDAHWNDSAELVLTAFIAFVCFCEADPAKRTLSVVRNIVSSPDRYNWAMATMQKVDNLVISRLGFLLAWFKDKELNSVLTTVNRHTQFLDSPAIAASVATSDFDPRILRSGRCTLYFILPHERLATLAPLMRLWLGMTIRTLARGGPDETKPVLMIIDEAAHLGKIQVLEDAVTLMRGVGIRLWFFFQSLSQLKACYGDKAEVMLDNFDTCQYFVTNSYAAAEAISQRIGEFTLGNVSYSENTGWSRPDGGGAKEPQSGSRSGGSSSTFSDMGRRLIRAEEILCLPEDTALVTHRNMPVIRTRLLRYFSAPEFKRGGCGKQPALGLAAIAFLVLGVAVAALPAKLPDPKLLRQAAHVPAFNARSRPGYASPYRPSYTPQPRRASYRSGGSGFLIPIH
jgi:type IV secretion system protein VirD4